MYADSLNMDDDEKEDFHFFIKRLDIAQIEALEKKKAAETPRKNRSI